MQAEARRLADRSFTGLGLFSIGLVGLALVVLLGPIVIRGAGALVFRGTIEHRRVLVHELGHGDARALSAELARARAARRPVYEALAACAAEHAALGAELRELRDRLRELLGPEPGAPPPPLPRERYGQTRWERARLKLHDVLYVERWDYSDPTRPGRREHVPRVEEFRGTPLEPILAPGTGYLATHLEEMLRPRWTCYGRFLLDNPVDAQVFGGIWPAVLGTLYLTLGAVLFAVPMGVIAAIYLVEYAGDHWLVRVLRSCVSTLAGVPSIVFGLFGLALFINTLHVSASKSVLAGALTLALLILPVVIRASEEALRAVPRTYKEAALSLGAGHGRTVATVLLPAALPGILTGIVISMGRAAGETAPIIFTAAVSVGPALAPWETLSLGTPALPWNIYSLCTEHQAVDEIRHVQYGMVLTLVVLVLILNGAALIMRARIARKLAG